MATIKWIKLATDVFEDEAIELIETMPEGDAIIVIWFKLLAKAGKINDSGMIYFKENIPYTDEMLSVVFKRPIPIIRLAIATFEKFGMIQVLDGRGILISNWEKHQSIDKLDIIREQTRKRVAKHREKQQLLSCNVTSNVTVTQSNALEEDKEEDKEEDIIKENYSKKLDPYCNPLKTFFEQEYKKVFNKRCYLSNSNCNKLVELSSEIENIRELIPTVLKKLKQINWKDIDFNPDTSWLLKGDNFISVLNGEHDKKKTPEELRKIARDSEVERTKAKLKELEQIEGTAPEDSETWKELGRKLKRV